MLDNAVGEYDAVAKICQLTRGPLPSDPQRTAEFFPLADLPAYLDGISGALIGLGKPHVNHR